MIEKPFLKVTCRDYQTFLPPDLVGCRAQEIQAIGTENFMSHLVAAGIDELCYLVLYGLSQRGPPIHKGEKL